MYKGLETNVELFSFKRKVLIECNEVKIYLLGLFINLFVCFMRAIFRRIAIEVLLRENCII